MDNPRHSNLVHQLAACLPCASCLLALLAVFAFNSQFHIASAGVATFPAGDAGPARATLKPGGANQTQAIHWDQIGAKAGVDYQGDGLAVTPEWNGARLRCVFQRLEGEATREGLWLISRVTNQTSDRFQVKAARLGRPGYASPLADTGTVSVDQQTVRIDPTFSDANWISMGGVAGPNGGVTAAVTDGLGNLYIGGDFTLVGDVVANRIAKWDGNSWTALGAGLGGDARFGGSVTALAVSGGNVYAGGYFTTADGSPANCVAKWDGSRWSALGSGIDGEVYALAVSGSEVYAGGDFTTATNTGGVAVTVNYIAKWNSSAWSPLRSGIGGVDYPRVSALAVSGSNVYAGGYFATAGGNLANGIAKWDGSNWSALGSGMGGDQFLSVDALVVAGSDLYAGGYFTTAGGSAATNMAKWDGSRWSALGSGIDGGVTALAVSGSDLYAAGGFSVAGGRPANCIAKWDGSRWTPLSSGIDIGGHGGVSALAVLGGDVYAGGLFWSVGDSGARHLAKWDGSRWTSPVSGSGMNGDVSALVVSGSDLYAGGDFTMAGGSAANSVAKWNGSAWSVLGWGMNGYGVYALAVSGSDVYAGGDFTMATNSGGVAASVNYIAKWNGSAWSTLGSGMDGGVRALALSGSELYAGGSFTWATNSGGVAVRVNSIAKWNGSAWSALGSGTDGGVRALAVSGSDLYAGGGFTTAGGSAANCIAKWDGSAWSTLGSGMNGAVHALAVSGSDVYAGGRFTTVSGAASCIAKWDGSAWRALGSGMNWGDDCVTALAVSGSDLYAGGIFTTATNTDGVAVTVNYIAKWNGSAWSALGSGMDSAVWALAVSGSDLYAGGYFTTAGGRPSRYVARAYLPPLPTLSVSRSISGVKVSWPSADTAGFALEQAGTLVAPISWVPHAASITDDGTNNWVNLPATNSAEFFRLRRP